MLMFTSPPSGLINHGVHGRVARKPLSSKKKMLAKDHVDKPEYYWEKGLMMDETKIELIGLNEKLLFSEKRPHCIPA